MIDYAKSAEINSMDIDDLKEYFKKYPGSEKQIIRICDNCNRKKKICFMDYTDLCKECAMRTPEYRRKMALAVSEAKLKPKEPLPSSEKIQIPDNKNCSLYLGCIAEELLAKTFKDVRRMPPQNHGFDIICNKDFKIDVKSSATGHTGRWLFTIAKNTIADYFLCITFESREDLIPIHVWLIPGSDVNHRTVIGIRKSTTSKWLRYEQPLDRVLACCDIMKGDN